MNSEEELINDVSDWIMNWVSVPNKNLGAVPCPFARNALITNKIHWVLCDHAEHLSNTLYSIMELGLPKEVVVLGCSKDKVSPWQLSTLTWEANSKWLMPAGLVALEDHPNDPEIVAGEKMNQGKWALILLQETAKLNAASEMLKRQGYYDSWTQEQIDDVVTWRFNQNQDQQ